MLSDLTEAQIVGQSVFDKQVQCLSCCFEFALNDSQLCRDSLCGICSGGLIMLSHQMAECHRQIVMDLPVTNREIADQVKERFRFVEATQLAHGVRVTEQTDCLARKHRDRSDVDPPSYQQEKDNIDNISTAALSKSGFVDQ